MNGIQLGRPSRPVFSAAAPCAPARKEGGLLAKPQSVAIQPARDGQATVVDFDDPQHATRMRLSSMGREDIRLATIKEFDRSACARLFEKMGLRTQAASRKENAIKLFKQLMKKSKGEIPQNPEQKNLIIAQALVQATRKEIYSKGSKSFNKLRPPPSNGVDANTWAQLELQRIFKAANELQKIQTHTRAKPPNHDAATQAAMEALGHNCTGISYAGIGVLKSAKMENFGLLSWNKFDHTAIVIGKLPAILPQRMEDWPPELSICDPWGNLACSAKDYPNQMLAKMKKWEQNGKLRGTFDPETKSITYKSPVYSDDMVDDIQMPSFYQNMSSR